MGIPHVTHAFFEAIVDLNVDEEDSTIHSQLDLNILEKFVEMSENDDDPEVS